jgi:hypothetical protein
VITFDKLVQGSYVGAIIVEYVDCHAIFIIRAAEFGKLCAKAVNYLRIYRAVDAGYDSIHKPPAQPVRIEKVLPLPGENRSLI